MILILEMFFDYCINDRNKMYLSLETMGYFLHNLLHFIQNKGLKEDKYIMKISDKSSARRWS